MKPVVVTESITGNQYKFFVDDDYEFVKMDEKILKRDATCLKTCDSNEEDEIKMRSYWDNSFGKRFFTEFTIKQQNELLTRNKNLHIGL